MKSIILIVVAVALASCSSSPNDGSGYDHGHGLAGLGGVAAGAVAYKMTDNKSKSTQMAWTAGSALAAFAFGEYVRGEVMNNMDEKYAMGYKMGMADATKRQYDIIQNRQKEHSGAKVRYRIYEFPGVDQKNGVNFHPHTVKIRVQE
jgi:hypothetical protein